MRLAILALPHIYGSCLSATLDVIRLTNAHSLTRLKETDPDATLRDVGWASPWSPTILSADGGPVRGSGGQAVPIQASALDVDVRFDAVFIPAFIMPNPTSATTKLIRNKELHTWLRQQRDQGAALVANHASIYLLAEAGILDNALATIPFSLEQQFRKKFPRVKLDMSRAIVETHDVICGAGLGTSYDLAWRIIQRHNSSAVSHRVFEDLFFDGSSLGSLAGMPHSHNTALDPLVERAQSWLLRNLANRVKMAELAQFLSTSERTLFRRFEQALGLTPHAYLTQLRLETAKKGLIHTAFRIDQIAAGIGYKDPAFFAQLFQSHTGLTPSDYRKTYRPVKESIV